ncbi:DUF1385 domain-containing protein [uncultured Megasphaera sp.]|uniref:DUF1385 domain-containing protein n=1 Tax=uncultured Megasphaera sp. TaxID=165188 RepID=UPI002592FB78|nr:DUF1385 domain-containing protein [uncultured Megasphaera sp.]
MSKPTTYVGGQAVIEGVMMRGPKYIATAVRTPVGDITVKKDEVHSLSDRYPVLKRPLLRGTIALYESLVYGMKCLSYSAQAAGEEDEELTKPQMMATMAFSIALAIIVFLLIPTYGAKFVPGVADSTMGLNIVEGVLRLLIFLLYIWGISLTSDIKRVFEYHGAEHKTIWTYESGEELTVENVRKHSRLHPRCGTNFLLIVMFVSIFVFAFLGWPNLFERVLSRVLLMPVVAGISYEMIRLAARTKSPLVQTLFKPGLYLQYLTTREPHDDQIEVAIEALNAAKPEDVNDQAQTCTVEIIAQETAPAASKVQDAVTSGTESA